MEKFRNDERVVYVFSKEECIDLEKDFLVIIKDDSEMQDDRCQIMHYSEDFESLLKVKLPTKIRKPHKLLSLQQCYDVMKRIDYGVLSITSDNYPYSVGINHIIVDNRIYFHCAKSGYKLNGIDKLASFTVIEDLGINLDVGTHNHRSVAVFGKLKMVEDNDIKRTALLQLVHDLAPKHPYHDRMLTTTHILELEIDFIIGKVHIH